jgi:hypothetical protein
MMPKLVTLEAWAAAQFGAAAPNADTLRRWARESRISPPPVKHGRTYFVAPDAVYGHAPAEAGNDDAPAGPRRSRLVERIKRDEAA